MTSTWSTHQVYDSLDGWDITSSVPDADGAPTLIATRLTQQNAELILKAARDVKFLHLSVAGKTSRSL